MVVKKNGSVQSSSDEVGEYLQEQQRIDRANAPPKNVRVPGAHNLERNQKHILMITHIATGFKVKFPAFLDSISDAYSSNWTQHPAYGRMDSMATFGSTKRNISVAWSVPAESFEHAQANLEKVNGLIQFLYPLYDNSRKDRDPVINMDPYWRLEFGNLIRNPKTGRGLLGYVNGITFDPEVTEGMFIDKPYAQIGGEFRGAGSSEFRRGPSGNQRTRIGTGNPQNNAYYPKTFRLNMEFKVLHEHSLGFAIADPNRKPADVDNSAVRTRATYAFSDPKLNYSNYPYQVPETERATSWRDQNAGLRGPKYNPVTNPDPVSPAVAIAVNPGNTFDESGNPPANADPNLTADGKKHGYVRGPDGRVRGGERTE